jgi:hypothetical protein
MKSCHKEHDCSSRRLIIMNKAVNLTALLGCYVEIMIGIMRYTRCPC